MCLHIFNPHNITPAPLPQLKQSRTTEDLFTQALYYAEEGIKLYRTIKEFATLVPAGSTKTQLVDQLDHIPSFCQSLNYIIKTPASGKSSAFTKVWRCFEL